LEKQERVNREKMKKKVCRKKKRKKDAFQKKRIKKQKRGSVIAAARGPWRKYSKVACQERKPGKTKERG